MNIKTALALLVLLGTLSLFSFAQAQEIDACTVANGCADLTDHDGYWVAKMKPPGSLFKIEIINDMHINTETMRVTVYAQSKLFGKVIAPAQLAPGECEDRKSGRVCFHPDAVYLNETGQELNVADGSGDWWVKHSWVLDGEGYDNSELKPMEVYPSFYVEGVLLDDSITMKIGNETWGHNLRRPLYSNKQKLAGYEVTRFEQQEQVDGSLQSEKIFTLNFKCKDRASAFDGEKRGCPVAND